LCRAIGAMRVSAAVRRANGNSHAGVTVAG
jgi:hypothetical protein